MNKLIFSIFALSILVSSCNDVEDPVSEAHFQKSDLHEDLSAHTIVPGFQDLHTQLNQLQINLDQAWSTESADDFETLKESWYAANKAFHLIKAFHFGPSMTHGLNAAFGTFPCDTAKINNNIEQNSFNLETADNSDAVGFAALEYLLFRPNAFEEALNSEATRTYISALVERMNVLAQTVENEWISSYQNEFNESTGTSSTSGFSLLVNEFTRDYELAKNAKLGIPLGKKTLGIPQTEFIEAPYAKVSLKLLKENMLFTQRIFNGQDSKNNDYKGFDDYLIALDKSALVDEINSELDEILSILDQLPESLVEAMETEESLLENLYVKMSDLVVHFKTDMTSAFGVLITYQDNDGD